MQTMSPSLLLRKRMSSETLEGGGQWTQEDVQQKSKIKITKYTCNMCTCAPHVHM